MNWYPLATGLHSSTLASPGTWTICFSIHGWRFLPLQSPRRNGLFTFSSYSCYSSSYNSLKYLIWTKHFKCHPCCIIIGNQPDCSILRVSNNFSSHSKEMINIPKVSMESWSRRQAKQKSCYRSHHNMATLAQNSQPFQDICVNCYHAWIRLCTPLRRGIKIHRRNISCRKMERFIGSYAQRHCKL